GIPIAATLRQVFAGDHAEPGRDHLHEDGHDAGQRYHPQQSVFELRPAGQVSAPVARVHVPDADQNSRTNESLPLWPEGGLGLRHLDRAVQAFERDMKGLYVRLAAIGHVMRSFYVVRHMNSRSITIL